MRCSHKIFCFYISVPLLHILTMIWWLYSLGNYHNLRIITISAAKAQCILREVLTKKRKKCEISHLGGGVRTKYGHFHTFFIFFLSCPKSCKSAKNFFLIWEGGYPLTWKSKFFGHTGCPKKNALLASLWVSDLGRGVFRGKK